MVKFRSCLTSDQFSLSLQDVGPCLAETNPEAAYTQLTAIRGHVVNQPLNFLEDDLSVTGKYKIPGAHYLICARDDEPRLPLPNYYMNDSQLC